MRYFQSSQARLPGRSCDRVLKAGKWLCLAFTCLGLTTFIKPALADVMDVSDDGSMTIYSTPGVYSLGKFQPIIPIPRAEPRSSHRPASAQIENLLDAAADRYAIDPKLLNAVAWNESHFKDGAISPKGAFGVMQLMEGTARGLGVNRYDLSQNILGGAAYLKQMLNRYDDVSLALAAYNAGPGAVDRNGGIPPFQETRNYVDTILGTIAHPIYSNPQSFVLIDR